MRKTKLPEMKARNTMSRTMAPKKETPTNAPLLKLRKKLKKTQKQMAEKLGVSLRTYQDYESGGAIPGPAKILISLIERNIY